MKKKSVGKKTESLEYISEEESGSDKFKTLKNKLKACQKEKEEYLGQAQRAMADLINFRRRVEEDSKKITKISKAALITDILPFLDSLEAGSKNSEEIGKLFNQIMAILAKQGLEAIITDNQKFDPMLHEAIESADAKEPGLILEQFQTGYKMDNFVLRPSRVKVSK